MEEKEMPHTVPPLPYDYNALESAIDEQTMHLHHDKHHQAYVDKLNDTLEKHPELRDKSAEELILDLNSVPQSIREAVRHNGGGHVNHTMFWEIMGPNGGGVPTGAIGDAIKKTFGGFEEFKKQFNEAGANQFGSGWVWLIFSGGKLQILTTPNQDSPLSEGHFPVLCNDVWEHAYYLRYQNLRAKYLEAWWNVVNWGAVNQRFAQTR
jgi:Fe-Mn family superoxide dismutase